MNSLKRRLSVGLTFFLSLLLILQWALVTIVIDRFTESQLTVRMESEIETLLANLEVSPSDGSILIEQQNLSSVYYRPFSGRYYVVCTSEKCWQSRSLWDETLDIDLLSSGQQEVLYLAGPEQDQLFTVVQGFVKSDQALTIAAAENIRPLRDDMKQFHLMFSLMSASGLILLLLVQWFIVGRALKPLDKIRQQLSRLGRGESQQIDASGPEEIRPMIEELNSLLHTMTRKTHRSRVALGNLAHALKTRLTVLSQLGEQKALQPHPTLKASLNKVTHDMTQIIERELKRARLVGGPMPGQRINLEQEIAELSRTLQLMHRDKSPVIDWQIATGTQFVGDREDFLELLGNLLDNACKWCRKHVEIRLYTTSQGCCIDVEDDGPGCQTDQLESLTRRGFRADESTPGSGLGLAIVFDIVDSYEGTLQFDHAQQLGGLRVKVCLPQRLSP